MGVLSVLTTAVVLSAVQYTSAVSLRSSPKPSNASAATADPSQALEAVMSMVGSMEEKRKPHHTATAGASPANGTRAKLDMGFTGFEKNLTEKLSAIMRESTTSQAWTNASRERLVVDVSKNITDSINEKLKPMKQSVGKTWMALPEDDQKNLYVAQLKQNFAPSFEDSMKTILSHFERNAKRVDANFGKLPADEMLAKTEEALTASVVSEHCYGGAMLLQLSLEELKEVRFVAAPSTNTSSGNHTHTNAGKFCLPSPIEHLVGRLNDAQGLLSMTMRFEAGAMDLAQTGKKGKKVIHGAKK